VVLSDGTSDWSHWGLVNAASFDHAASGGSLTLAATTALTYYANNAYSFSWIAGAPTATANNTQTGVYIVQPMRSITITAPADTSQRTLRVFTDVYFSAATVTAKLSDMLQPGYADSSFVDMIGVANVRIYTFIYTAGSPGQSLVVTLALDSVMTNGNLAVPAATLTSP
jgi:hypothetical protein